MRNDTSWLTTVSLACVLLAPLLPSLRMILKYTLIAMVGEKVIKELKKGR